MPAVLAAFLLVGGCGGFSPKTYVRKDIDRGKIKKVAVLPLDSMCEDKLAGLKIRMALISELLSKGVDVVEPGEVNNALINLNVQYIRSLTGEQIKAIGKKLGVHAILTGTVAEYSMQKGVRDSYPEISVNITMYDADTGRILLSSYQTTGGASFWTEYFGADDESLNEATRKVVKQAVNSFSRAFRKPSRPGRIVWLENLPKEQPSP